MDSGSMVQYLLGLMFLLLHMKLFCPSTNENHTNKEAQDMMECLLFPWQLRVSKGHRIVSNSP